MVTLRSEPICDRCGEPLKQGHACVAKINMDHLNALLDLYNYAEESLHVKLCKRRECRACVAIKKIRMFA